jgi:pyridoxamine 5'-phosphate oxidase
MDLADMREQYSDRGLLEGDLDPDPIVQFRAWFEEWAATGPYDPSTMVLSTVDGDGWPTARAVLLKGLDERGFVFYTNRRSAKGRDLRGSARAALTFVWHPIERQVRILGDVELLPADESDAYFASRPRDSQIGAWASHQSEVIGGRDELEAAVAETETTFPDEVPRPDHWGGYLVRPLSIEFWQGRRNRLHDRLRYRRAPDGAWSVERLSP